MKVWGLTLALTTVLVLGSGPRVYARSGGGAPGHSGAGYGGGGHSSPHYGYRGYGYSNNRGFGRNRSDLWPFYFGDYPLFADDNSYPPAEAENAPMAAMQPPSAFAEPVRPKASPLLIELEGDRYVRYGGSPYGGSARSSETSLRSSGTTARAAIPGAENIRAAGVDSSRNVASPAPSPLAPAVIVFRDGHQEEISSYSIVGRTLYTRDASSESGTVPGYGLRNIQLSSVDLTATIKLNRENGVNFLLPSGPNEVVTRP